MKKNLILVIMILLSCIGFWFSGMMLGFHKGQRHIYEQMAHEEAEREKNKTYKISEKPGRPIIGTPIKSRRFKSKLLGNTREISPEARARIAMIK